MDAIDLPACNFTDTSNQGRCYCHSVGKRNAWLSPYLEKFKMRREVTPEFIEAADRKTTAHNVPVRNAATLLLVDWGKKTPHLLVGKRKSTLAFMPGLTVFPGGASDVTDAAMESADELSPETKHRLRLRASSLSQRGARGLALAAIRETFEETGVMYGIKQKPASFPSEDWKAFAEHNVTPVLSDLHLVARAITPSYRPRRFDTRFFLGKKEGIVKTVQLVEETDLENIEWLRLEEIFERPLAFITRQILTDLTPLLQGKAELTQSFPFYYSSGKKYFCEMMD
jgi:8-oxo-dGTP pyrophosphatase MutT (NUDIX family)